MLGCAGLYVIKVKFDKAGQLLLEGSLAAVDY